MVAKAFEYIDEPHISDDKLVAVFRASDRTQGTIHHRRYFWDLPVFSKEVSALILAGCLITDVQMQND